MTVLSAKGSAPNIKAQPLLLSAYNFCLRVQRDQQKKEREMRFAEMYKQVHLLDYPNWSKFYCQYPEEEPKAWRGSLHSRSCGAGSEPPALCTDSLITES